MRLRSLLTILVLSLALVGCSKFAGGGEAWKGDPQKAHELTAGMSQEQVKKILGEPSRTQEMKVLDQSLTAWYYVGDKDNVNVVFDTGGKLNTVGVNGQVLFGPDGE